LTFSCYRRFPFLTAERTRCWLADAIETARIKFEFDVWAFVFMPEHAHIIVRPRPVEYDIGRIRGAIKEPVGRKAVKFLERESPEWLPRITRTRGQRTERCFWMSGGGYDRNVIEPSTLARMIEYIHLNPVRRNLVKQARDWKWSSAGWFEGAALCPLVPDPIPPEWGV
jgi:putative transposase